MYRTEPREITESFRLERVLKSSRSAIVFRAVEPGSGTTVAIKLIPPSSPLDIEARRERFLQAMGALAAAAPEAFPALLDYGFSPDGSAFMVMELVEGERLDTLAGTPPERVLNLILDAVEGLETLASRGVWHGNLAPENLLALARGAGDRVRILGFGTAAFHGALAGAGVPGLVEGPAQFAAPEQFDPSVGVAPDWRSDLYALAATACNVLQAGIVPADAPEPEVMLPPHVRATLPDAEALQAILAQALRRAPAERPADLEAFRQGIRRALGHEAPTPARREEAAEAAARMLAVSEAAVFTPATHAGAGEVASAPAAAAASAPEAGEETSPLGVVPAPPARPEEGAEAEPAPPSLVTPAAPVTGELSTALPPMPQAEFEAAPVATTPQPAWSAEAATPIAPAAAPAVATLPVASEPLPAAVEAPPGSEPEPAQPALPEPAKAAAKPRRKRSALPWAIAIAAAVVLGSAAGLLWMWNQQAARPAPPAPPTAVPRAPTPSPQPAPTNDPATQLAKAEAAVALADFPAAVAALDAIAPADLAAFPAADQERYRTLRGACATARRQALTKDMQRAIGAGNLRLLGDTVRGISKEEEATFRGDADFSASLDEARRALTVQATMLKAQHSGDQAQVLQSASVLVEIMPKSGQAVDAREKAAAALEHDADQLEAKGNFTQALDRLEAIRRSWPARPGLAARLERVQAGQESERRLGALLAQAEQAGADNAPEKGLELLKSAPSDARGAERVARLRERLAAQLQQIDAQPPTVALAPAFKLEYKKGEPVTIPLKIADDHAVKSAQLFARVEGAGRFVELQLRHASGADWNAEISVAFHQNQTVEFYVTATDYSGHVGQLGSAQAPIKLKRKKNIFGF